MTTGLSTTSRLLPVSILAGPSAHALVHDVVSRDAKCPVGLLASSPFDAQITHDKLIVEQLVAANGGGSDPGANKSTDRGNRGKSGG